MRTWQASPRGCWKSCCGCWPSECWFLPLVSLGRCTGPVESTHLSVQPPPGWSYQFKPETLTQPASQHETSTLHSKLLQWVSESLERKLTLSSDNTIQLIRKWLVLFFVLLKRTSESYRNPTVAKWHPKLNIHLHKTIISQSTQSDISYTGFQVSPHRL